MSKGQRKPYDQVAVIAMDISMQFQAAGVQHMIGGSLRRGVKKDVGDIDIVVSDLIKAHEILAPKEGLLSLPKPLPKAPKGKIRRTVDVEHQRLTVNLYMAFEEEWGAMVLFLTGNGMFNIQLRAMAKRQGLKLNQYGLWEGANVIAGRTEEQIFRALGLRMIEPWEREFKPGIWAIENFKDF